MHFGWKQQHEAGRHVLRWCWCEQIALMTFTLVPLRALLAFCCLVLSWFWAVVALTGRSQADAQHPLSGWRK